MSKIKLTGHASGSGVLTIAAPNTDSDRTITLPDVTGTLLDSGSDLPAANLTGTVADARISTLTASKLTGDLPAISGANLTGISSVGGATGVDFNDNVKARFGTGNDLEIYHDGTDSYIHDSGTGNLELRTNGAQIGIMAINGSEYMGKFVQGNQVELYYNNSKKFETTSEGSKVTGHLRLNNSQEMQLGGSATHIEGDSGYMAFDVGSTERLRITNAGLGLSQFTAKAWIHISNNSTINDSHNISSLTDVTTGRMRIYFSTNPASANYSISAITSKNGGGASSSNFGKVCIPEDKYSSYFQLFTQLGTSNTDTVHTSAVIFGD